MKKKEYSVYKNKPVVEIQKEIAVLREKWARLKFDLTRGKVKNIQEVHAVKKSIAQLLTISNQQK